MIDQTLLKFNESEHSYEYDGKQLVSVTQVIKKYILPNLYSGVDPALLAAKAQHGTDVHKQIEMMSNGFEPSEPFDETSKYIEWLSANKETHDVVDSECAVTDGELIAGTIDQVVRIGEDEWGVCDLKTTSTLNKEYLRWQLSLYAYMLEHMHDGKQYRLFAMHLTKDECKRVEIERIPDDVIESLLESIRSGAEVFDNPLKQTCGEAEDLIKEYARLDAELMDYDVVVKQIKKQQDDIKERLMKLSEEKKQLEFDTTLAKVKVTPEHTQSSFNKDAFMKSAETFLSAYRPEEEDKQQAFDAAWKEAVDGGMKVSSVKGKVTITYNK